MNTLAKLLRLDFVPRSNDLALLVLRLWVGLSMLILHGWDKFMNFEEKSQKFMTLFGLGPKVSLGMAVFGEVFASILIACGLFTRFGALCGAITMSVAFFLAHKGVLKGPGNGELAYLYLAAYVVLLIAGGGRFSADANMGGKA